MNDNWFYSEGGKGFGPFTRSQLEALRDIGKLKPTDLVWQAGQKESRFLKDISWPDKPPTLFVSAGADDQPSRGAIGFAIAIIAAIVIVSIYFLSNWHSLDRVVGALQPLVGAISDGDVSTERKSIPIPEPNLANRPSDAEQEKVVAKRTDDPTLDNTGGDQKLNPVAAAKVVDQAKSESAQPQDSLNQSAKDKPTDPPTSDRLANEKVEGDAKNEKQSTDKTSAAHAEMASLPEPVMRIWTSSNGKHTREASFIELKDGVVRLHQKDGEIATVALEALSQGDAKWIAEYLSKLPIRSQSANSPVETPKPVADEVIDPGKQIYDELMIAFDAVRTSRDEPTQILREKAYAAAIESCTKAVDGKEIKIELEIVDVDQNTLTVKKPVTLFGEFAKFDTSIQVDWPSEKLESIRPGNKLILSGKSQLAIHRYSTGGVDQLIAGCYDDTYGRTFPYPVEFSIYLYPYTVTLME